MDLLKILWIVWINQSADRDQDVTSTNFFLIVTVAARAVFDIADDVVILNSGRVAVVSTPQKLTGDDVDLRQHLGVF